MDTISHDVMAADALAEGAALAVAAGPWQVLLVRIAGEVHALNNRCSHAASPLDGGRVRGKMVICPLHGARFDVTTGRCLGAAYAAIRTFPVSIEDGRVIVAVPNRPPEMNEAPIMVRR